MKTVSGKKLVAQGDLLLVPFKGDIPDGFKEENAKNNSHVVAHSETGHHHFMKAEGVQYFTGQDPLVAYLKVNTDFADLVHSRSYDTHETLRIPRGTYALRRQREHTPEGWRRVED